jgi:hypothetical protein
MHFFTTKMHLVKNLLANVVGPTGCPRRQKPWVSLTGIASAVVSVGWGVVENVASVLAIDRPSSGLGGGDERKWGHAIAGGEDPYFCHVYEAAEGCAIGFECVAEEFEIGEVDTGVEMLSTQDRRWVMPPYSSLLGSPNASHSAACSRSKVSISSRRRATMKEAKSCESGQPCVTPSSMRSWLRRTICDVQCLLCYRRV